MTLMRARDLDLYSQTQVPGGTRDNTTSIRDIDDDVGIICKRHRKCRETRSNNDGSESSCKLLCFIMSPNRVNDSELSMYNIILKTI